MQRLLVTICLVLAAGPAYGEWTLVVGPESKGMQAYVDFGTSQRNGNLVTMWQLSDYTTAQEVGGTTYLSAKIEKEYDCAEERFRILALTYFSGHMGGGNVITTITPNEKPWLPVQPDSLGKQIWEAACTFEGSQDKR